MKRSEATIGFLTDRVRFATEKQLAIVHEITPSEVGRELRALAKAGWVESASLALRRPRVECPIMTDLDPMTMIPSVSWKLESRWDKAEPERTRIWWASRRASKLYGGRFSGVKQTLQIEHDLMILDVLQKRKCFAKLEWLCEDDLRDSTALFDGKLPDAIIAEGEGVKVIEVGGRYSVERLKDFISAMNWARMAFEIW